MDGISQHVQQQQQQQQQQQGTLLASAYDHPCSCAAERVNVPATLHAALTEYAYEILPVRSVLLGAAAAIQLVLRTGMHCRVCGSAAQEDRLQQGGGPGH